MLDIYYPIDKHEKLSRLNLITKDVIRALVTRHKLGFAYLFDHISLSHIEVGFKSISISKKQSKYPILIFSHGMGSVANFYSSTLKNLSAKGYIVLGITHGDQSAILQKLPSSTIPHLDDLDDYYNYEVRSNQLKQRESEIKYVINLLHSQEINMVHHHHINRNNNFDQIMQYIDLNKIGLFGHSFGLATAASYAYADDRIKVLFGIDLWTIPLAKHILHQKHRILPTLFIESNEWYHKQEFLIRKDIFFNKNHIHKHSQYYMMKDTSHLNFNDIPMFCAYLLKKSKITGNISPKLCLLLCDYYFSTFLNSIFYNKKKPKVPSYLKKYMIPINYE